MRRLHSKPAEEIEKKWGRELIIENNDRYCGKILEIKEGCRFSMHFHIDKDETWYVKSGYLILTYIDTTDASSHDIFLKSGDVVRVYPGFPHQLYALQTSEIFEISTKHQDEDSYRVMPGDSQKLV